MAKGDDARSRNKIEEQGSLAQNNLDNLRNDTLIPQNQAFWNNYLTSTAKADADYNNLMSGFGEFAETGGFTPEGISAIRSRAVSPTRAVYSNANREVDRSKAIQGGYSPGHGVLKGRMAREMSSGISDASTNAEAAIAQLVQSGKLAGLTGGSSLYGTTPGAANMFGNQVLGSTSQRLQGEGLQQGLSLGTMDAQIQASRLPGNWENAMGRINDIFNLGKNLAGMGAPLLGSGSGAPLQTGQMPGTGNINSGLYDAPTTPTANNPSGYVEQDFVNKPDWTGGENDIFSSPFPGTDSINSGIYNLPPTPTQNRPKYGASSIRPSGYQPRLTQ